MSKTMFETRLVFQSRLASGALVFLFLITLLATWSGLQAVRAQKNALERIELAHHEDLARVASRYKDGSDAGYAAYYTQHFTWDEPTALAFAAFGHRDLQPFSLRIRLLGLHSQLYESETINPELALPGRFDFAFVLVYLVPLVVIALMHDLLTSERESGRLRLIASLPTPHTRFWIGRVALRFGYVALATLLPFLATALYSGANVKEVTGVAAIAAAYMAFWFGLGLMIGAITRSSANSAAILLGCFVVLTLVLPTIANAVITRAIPVAKGVELMLAQRQEVHQGWDLPKAVTFEKFFLTHPEWSDTPPVTERFHWKWYYAMHQVGDDAVAPQAEQYQQSLKQRENWTRVLGLFLPPVGAQVTLHRMAHTDLKAQLDYQQRIAAFHAQLRRYYYPYVFQGRSFGRQEFDQLPKFEPVGRSGTLFVNGLFALILMAAGVLYCGVKFLRRIEV